MAGSAISTPTFQAVNANIANDGSADSPRGWAIASDSNYTFTNTSPSRVRCSGLAAQRTVTLPTTGIKAGAEFEVLVTGATETNYLLINSSGGNEVERIGGEGKVTVVSLQDAPTTAVHWQVKDVWETCTGSGAGTGANTNTITYKLTRVNKVVTFLGYQTSTTASATNNISTPAVPVRFRPTTQQTTGWVIRNNTGSYTSAMIEFKTTGVFAAYLPALANFSGDCCFGVSSGVSSSASYQLA